MSMGIPLTICSFQSLHLCSARDILLNASSFFPLDFFSIFFTTELNCNNEYNSTLKVPLSLQGCVEGEGPIV